MKILIVTQYFWPEYFLINKLSQILANLGHEVAVATGKPNYPEGEIYEGYRASGIIKEWYGNVEVFRVPLSPRGKGTLRLIVNYLSFIFSGIRYFPSFFKKRHFDAILVFAPSPIISAIPAIWLNRKKNAHLAVWVQDLWPQSLKATGYIKNRQILFLVGLLVRWIYSKCDTVLAQSHAFEGAIEEYASKDKILFYPNSIEREEPNISALDLPTNIKKIFDTGFNLVFTGNIGSAQSMPTLLRTARLLQNTDCRFIFVGNGSLLEWAKCEVNRLNLDNVIFLGRLDNSLMPFIYECADALLISLTGKKIFSYTIPGKLQAYLAAGKPIVASLDGEAAEIVCEAKAGIVCAAEDSDALEKGIRQLLELPQSVRDEMGRSGYRYFSKNFDINILAERLVDIFDLRIKVCEQ